MKNEIFGIECKYKIVFFDTFVGSVANYGCEVWGSHPAKDIEKVHLNFCKNNTWCVEKYTVS